MSPQITVHHLDGSRSVRLWWLLEELGLPFEAVAYKRLPNRAAPPELKKVSPFGKAPVITIDGEVVSESGYIVHRLSALAPNSPNVESPSSDNSIYWSHFSEGGLMITFQAMFVLGGTSKAWSSGIMGDLNEEEREGVKKYGEFMQTGFYGPQGQIALDEIDKFLTEHPGKFFSGTDKPGQGDFMMFGPMFLFFNGPAKAAFKVGKGLEAWWEMVLARPSVKSALQRMKECEEAGSYKSGA